MIDMDCPSCGYPHPAVIRRWELNPRQLLIECPNCGELMTVKNPSFVEEGNGCGGRSASFA